MLWLVFFVVGFIPKPVFHFLRDFAHVDARRALVNSPALITLALAAYFAFFVFVACRRAKVSQQEAEARAVQCGLLALLAFLEAPYSGTQEPGLTALAISLSQLDKASQIWIAATIAIKSLVWLYLVSLLLRHYLASKPQAFVRMPLLFHVPRDHEGGGASPRQEPDCGENDDDL